MNKADYSYSHTHTYTHTPGQRLEGESRLSQKVCHYHRPFVGLACNLQFTLKIFATSLTWLPCCFSLCFSHWLNLFLPSSTPFSSPCSAAQCLWGPLRHSIIPLTTTSLHSPPHSFPLSVFLISPLLPHIVPTPASCWFRLSWGQGRI